MSYISLLAHEVLDLLADPDVAVLDMRDAQSFNNGHLPRAQPASEEAVARLIRDKRRERSILIYCYHGNSSRDLATFLAGLGFTHVYNLEGGWQAWATLQAPQEPMPDTIAGWATERGFDLGDINGRIDNGMSPLMLAAMEGREDIVLVLLQSGADTSMVNEDQNNALWFACYNGDLAIIERLIAHGTDINNQNVNGATCLIYASSAGKHEVVKALVEAGADLGQTTHDGFNALDSAATLPVLRYLKPRYAIP